MRPEPPSPILHCSGAILCHSCAILCCSCATLRRSCAILHCSCTILHRSCAILHCSCAILQCSCTIIHVRSMAEDTGATLQQRECPGPDVLNAHTRNHAAKQKTWVSLGIILGLSLGISLDFLRFPIPGSTEFQWSPVHFPRILRSVFQQWPSSSNPRFLIRSPASRQTWHFTKFLLGLLLGFY